MRINNVSEWKCFAINFSDNTEKMFIMSPSHYAEARRIVNMYNRKQITEDACKSILLSLDKN